MYVML
jgi:26S proteasome regulatory subunit N3